MSEPRETAQEKEAAVPAAANDDSKSSASESDEQHHFTISQVLFESLSQKGFSENAIKKSIVAGCVDEGTCTQWIKMHEGHPELDTPLETGVEVTIKAKRILTESEREEKVRELQEKIKQKKADEKMEAARKEKERVEMGRKALEVKEQMEEVRRKMELEEIKREKAADAAARRRIKIQLIADRYARLGKGREEAWQLAERDFQEELDKSREAAVERARKLQEASQDSVTSNSAAAGEGASWNLSSVVHASADRLQTIFDEKSADEATSIAALAASLRSGASGGKGQQCIDTLATILSNIVASPLEMKKRALRTGTKVFSQHVKPFDDAVRILKLCGFDLSTDAEGNQTIACTTVIMWRLKYAVACLRG